MATYKTVTVDSSGADYTSFEAAKDNEATDLTATVGDLIIQAQDGFQDTGRLLDDGAYTTDSTHRIIFEGASSLAKVGWDASGTGVNFTGGVDSTLWHMPSNQHYVIRDLQFYYNYDGSFGNRYILNTVADSSTVLTVERCVFLHDGTGSSSSGYKTVNVNLEAATQQVFRNCLFAALESTGVSQAFESGTSGGTSPLLENCTFDNYAGGAFGNGFTDAKLLNCRVTNSGAEDDNFTTDSDYNLTDRGDAPADFLGTNGIGSATLDYVDAGNATFKSRDWALNSNTDDGWGSGTTSVGTSVDILGASRTDPYDIGAHEGSISTVTAVSSSDGADAGDSATADLTVPNSETDGAEAGDTADALFSFTDSETDGVEAGDSATSDLIVRVQDAHKLGDWSSGTALSSTVSDTLPTGFSHGFVWELEDDDSVDSIWSGLDLITIPTDGGLWRTSGFVKKTPTSPGYACYLELKQTGGDSDHFNGITFNTETGDILSSSVVLRRMTVVSWDSNWWYVFADQNQQGTSNTLGTVVYPAARDDVSGGADGTLTGTQRVFGFRTFRVDEARAGDSATAGLRYSDSGTDGGEAGDSVSNVVVRSHSKLCLVYD